MVALDDRANCVEDLHREAARPSTTVNTDVEGNATFDMSLAAAAGFLTATATAAVSGSTSEFSTCIALPPTGDFRRGDANQDGSLDLSDAVTMRAVLFVPGGVSTCADAVDADDDGNLNIADPIFLLNHLFTGGMAPPAPGFLSCGADPTADALICSSFGC